MSATMLGFPSIAPGTNISTHKSVRLIRYSLYRRHGESLNRIQRTETLLPSETECGIGAFSEEKKRANLNNNARS
jgi:hypothetical protein